MMHPGELVRALAGAFEVSELEVIQFDRRLMSGGMRSTGGRGRSAVNVVPWDFTRLLIATVLRMPLAETVPMVTKWENLDLVNGSVDPELLPWRLRFAIVENDHSFGKFLSVVIANWADNERPPDLFDFCVKLVPQEMKAEIQLPDITLAFWGSLDVDAPRKNFRTTHEIDGKLIVEIAKQMRK